MNGSRLEEQSAQTQEDEVKRGRRAEVLLREPLIVEAFETLDRVFYQVFREVAPTDHQGLIHLRLLIKCLDEFKGFFEEVLTSGKLTQEQVREVLELDASIEDLERQRLRR